MTQLAASLASLATAEEKPLTTMVRRVSAVGEDNTVNLDWGSPLPGVPCSSAYPYRAVDDIVLVVKLPSGGWQVLAKLGTAAEERVELPAVLNATTTPRIEYPNPADIPPEVTVSWGTAAPTGTGWVDVTAYTIRVRDAGSGKRDFHFQAATAPPPGSTKPPTPTNPDPIPSPVTISPSTRKAFRAGGQTDDTVKQASWSGQAWRGLWHFGTSIKDACSGKTVKAMTIKLTRSGNGGWNRDVPVRLYLTEATGTVNRPGLDSSRWTPTELEPSGSATVTLPASWRDSLAAGTARGIVAWAEGSDEYIIFGGSSGSVRITFQ